MENRNIGVYPMTFEDVDAVHNIEEDSFSVPWSKDSFVQEIRFNRLANYWVMKLDDEVIGYGGCWFVIDEAHVTNIAIHKKYRGNGYGKMLVLAMMKDVQKQGIKAIGLEVRKSNEIARTMYESMGFKMERVRKNYYDSPKEDALVLWKSL